MINFEGFKDILFLSLLDRAVYDVELGFVAIS